MNPQDNPTWRVDYSVQDRVAAAETPSYAAHFREIEACIGQDKVRFLRWCEPGAPRINEVGDYQGDDISPLPFVNEPQLLATALRDDGDLTIEGRVARFSQVQHLRGHSRGISGMIVSANVLLVDGDRKRVLFQQRVGDVASGKNRLHLFGGAYAPKTHRFAKHDYGSLAYTASRELMEETKVPVAVSKEWPVALMEERDLGEGLGVGFVQANYLGVEIGDWGASRIRHFGDDEGTVEPIAFDDLPERLVSEDVMLPTCRAAVLLWLAMGARVLEFKVLRAQFDADKARAMYRAVVHGSREAAA